ncbi:MAG: 23S rRNA (uracil(1939)-C(5))-methyltransferase RlmD [candidate division WOR-3 bacterium]
MVIELKIDKVIFGGFGLGEYQGIKVFVPYSLPEEKLSVKIKEKKKHYWLGEISEILESSPFRVKPKCPVFTKCGGCDFQHADYTYQLILKKLLVSDCLEHLGNIFFPPKNPLPVNPWYYRNKVQMMFGQDKNKPLIGYYQKNTHKIIETANCFINPYIFNEIKNYFTQFLHSSNLEIYDEIPKTGNLRFLVLRKGNKTDEILLIVVGRFYEKEIDKFYESLPKETKEKIVGFLFNVNPFPKNRILTDNFLSIFGRDYYFEELLNRKFRVSASSFFQNHYEATELLLKRIIELIEPEEKDRVLDLYSGVGVFSIILSSYVKEIAGIESEKNSYEDALFNKLINDCFNVNFLLGKCEEVLDSFNNIDKAILDPPRKGIEEKVIEHLKRIKPRIILYVSCNPATFSRDLKRILEIGYEIETIELFDMFPQTYHIEVLGKLVRKPNGILN